MTITIDLCDGWTKIGEAGGGTFDAVVRNLAIGEWTLTADTAGLDLQSSKTPDDIDTIRAVDGRFIEFAGFVAPVTEGAGGLEVQRDSNGEHFTIGGPDLWHIPRSRLAYPDPTSAPPWVTSFDARTGLASSVAAQYIDVNLGAGALADRQYSGVTIVDRSAGIFGAWSARLQPLDELVQRICREGGITCKLAVDYTGALLVDLGAATDRQATVVLSDQGDLVNVRRRRTSASASFVLAGGQGQLTARTFRAAGGGTGAARRETFTDQSSLSTSTELQQSADANLAAKGADWSIHAELSTTAAQQLVYGTDYQLGDIVAAEIDNVRHLVPVTAVRFHVDPDRQTVIPVLGDAAPDLLAGLVRDVAGLAARFDTHIA